MSSESTIAPPQVLTLHSPNPLDLSPEDLATLSAEITASIAQADRRDLLIRVDSYEPLGVGNTLNDLLHVVLPNAEFMKDTIFATVVASATAFMQARFKRKHESKRRRKIYFQAPDGRVLGTLVLQSEDSEAVWFDPNQ